MLAAGDNPPAVSAPIVDSGVVMNYYYGDYNCSCKTWRAMPTATVAPIRKTATFLELRRQYLNARPCRMVQRGIHRLPTSR